MAPKKLTVYPIVRSTLTEKKTQNKRKAVSDLPFFLNTRKSKKQNNKRLISADVANENKFFTSEG
jgi:hypothetical protein